MATEFALENKPSREQVDRYKTLVKKGKISKLPLDRQKELARIFGGETQETLTLPLGGKKKVTTRFPGPEVPDTTIVDTKPTIFAKAKKSLGEATDIPFTDIPNPAAKIVSAPLQGLLSLFPQETLDEKEVLRKPKETVELERKGLGGLLEAEAAKVGVSVSRDFGIPFLLEKTGLVEEGSLEKSLGVTRQEIEKMPAYQTLLSSLPAEAAFTAVGGKIASQLGKTKTVQRLLPSLQEKSKRALAIKKIRQSKLASNKKKVAERQVKVMTETIEDFVKGKEITDDLAQDAINQGFPLKEPTSTSLKESLVVSNRMKEKSGRAMRRNAGMTQDEAAQIVADKTGFKPSVKDIETPVPTLQGDVVDQARKEASEEIAQKFGTGVPDLSDASIPDPSKLGGKPTVSKAGRLNLENIPANEEDMLGAVQQMVEVNAPKHESVRLLGDNPLSFKQARKMAESDGITVGQAFKRQKGEAWNPLEFTVIKEETNKKVLDLWTLTKKLDPSNPEHVKTWTKEFLDTSAMQMTLEGGKSEAARTLAFSRNLTRNDKLMAKISKELGIMIRNSKDPELLMRKFAEIDPTDIPAMNHFLQSLRMSRLEKFSAGAYELWINSILSGPITQAKNVTSNVLVAMTRPLITTGAAAVDVGRVGSQKALRGVARKFAKDGSPLEVFAKKKIQRETFFGEAKQEAFGFMTGMKRALPNAIETFRTGVSKFGGEKFGTGAVGVIPGKTGKALRLPGRALQTVDEFFKTLNFEMSIKGGAYAQASKEGLRGGKFIDRVAELSSRPTKEMFERAVEDAKRFTFTKDLRGVPAKFSKAIRIAPGMRYMQPFITTPTNIIEMGLEMTPAGLPMTVYKNKVHGQTLRQINDQVARMMLGTVGLVGAGAKGVSTLNNIRKQEVDRGVVDNPESYVTASLLSGGVAQLYSEGLITGAPPQDPRERKAWFMVNKPYSVLVDGKWVSYASEPFGVALGTMVDFVQAMDYMETSDAAMALSIGLVANLGEKSFLGGLKNISDILASPTTKKLSRFSGRMATGFIPFSGALRQTAQVMDPKLRQAETFTEEIQGSLPFLREKLPPMYDLYGKEIIPEPHALNKLVPMFKTSDYKADPFINDMLSLGVYPTPIRKKDGAGEMTRRTYELAQQLRGAKLEELGKEFVSDPDYKSLKDFEKVEKMERIFQKANKFYRSQLGLVQQNKAINNLLDDIDIARQENNVKDELSAKEDLRNLIMEGVSKLSPKGKARLKKILTKKKDR